MGVGELPPPVAFRLRRGETREIRTAVSGSSMQSWIFTFNFVVGLANGMLRLVWRGWHDLLGWAFVGSYVVLFVGFSATRYRRLSGIKPDVDFAIAFGETRVEFVSARRTASFAYGRIDRVRVLPSAILIEPKRSPCFAVPRRALPHDGAGLIRFFESRLIGKRLLRREPASTLIVNTADS